MSSGRSDGHGRHGAAGPGQRRLPPDGVRAVDRMVHVPLATVRVVDRERLNTHTTRHSDINAVHNQDLSLNRRHTYPHPSPQSCLFYL